MADAHTLFTALVGHTRAPTAAFGVLIDGRPAEAGGVGGGTSSTRFRIASMTKSFTAALVLTLRDEGRIDLDARVAALCPELAALDSAAAHAWPGSAPITVRHLLTMAAGLPNDDPWADRHLDASAADLDAVLSGGVASIAAPGSRYEYSNLGYACVGRIVERVTGSRPQDLISERILGPLGMHSTGWDAPTDGMGWARPYRIEDDRVTPEGLPPLGDGVIAPMGGLWSTVDDLAAWVAFLSDLTRPGPLSAASRTEMTAIATPFPEHGRGPAGGSGGYGMGLVVIHDRTVGDLISHSGGLPGYGSNMCWLRGGHVAVVSLANITYAPMGPANRTLIHHLVQSEAPPSDAVSMLGVRLVALLNDWSDAAAESLFSDNVALDQDLDRRAAAAVALVAQHGTLQISVVDAGHPGGAKLTLLGSLSRRLLVCSFSRAPHAEPRIQHYEVEPWR